MSHRSPPMRRFMPHRMIGAQDLISGPHEHSGFLRKRGQKERLFENLKLSKHVNWRQRFIVVSDGFCYCYEDEVANVPLHVFSLFGYKRVFRTASDRNEFCFAIEPAAKWRNKLYIFACSSESDRKLWMQAFRSAMIEANTITVNSDKCDSQCKTVKPEKSSGYTELEQPLHLASNVIDSDDEVDSSTDSDSSDVSDVSGKEKGKISEQSGPYQKTGVPLPPIPLSEGVPADLTSFSIVAPTAQPRKKKNKPLDARKRESQTSPRKQTQKTCLTEKDCLIDSNDREHAIEILREKKVPGTFLIRRSRQGDSKVLAVLTNDDVKEYKIFDENGEISLDKKTYFKTIDDLLENYSRAPLPNRDQKLSRSYSCTENCSPTCR